MRVARHGLRSGLVFLALLGALTLPATLAATGAWQAGYRESSWYSAPRAAAEHINQLLAPDERVGSFNAGLLGFLTNCHVVNLDGLANNWELLEARKAGRTREYLEGMNIRFIADVGHPDAYRERLRIEADEYDIQFRAGDTGGFVARVALQSP